jgi:hypothetical protein
MKAEAFVQKLEQQLLQLTAGKSDEEARQIYTEALSKLKKPELRIFLAAEQAREKNSPITANLRDVLQSCVKARGLIESEQAKILPLIRDAANPIEEAARQYQHDLIALQLNRAADIAEKRLRYIRGITDFAAENQKCAEDTVHWFEYYAWTVDPRVPALSVMPLGLFPFQERYIAWLDSITFDLQSSGVVEKSRTMGATEIALRWMLKHWRYRDNFFGMPLSANEDLVDSKKDPGTLFEKLRFQLRLLPSWMLPKGFDLNRDMPFMQLSNGENGSVLQGDAPTINVGRQRRATFVLKDESAAWPNGGYQQHTSLSRTALTLCDISSVQGKFNKFADIALDGRTPKFEMDWREHPWLDDRWYDSLPFGYIGPAMTQEEIAQEIDRNYDSSQPGRVITNCKEEFSFITWSELIAGFAEKGRQLSNGVVPAGWNWGRVSDYGISAKTENDTHIWAYNLFARPAEGWPLNDSLFFFLALPIEPIGATELQAFQFYSSLEREFGVRGATSLTRRPTVNDMSHEATDPKEVLLTQCGDNWNIPDLDFHRGVSKLRFHFELTDTHLKNPFRPQLDGRSRIYFVAPDGEYQMAYNERSATHFVTPSQTQRGYKRLRAEINSWHFPPEERGKPVQKMRPKSIFDDIITTVRYALARWGVQAAPMSKAERTERKLRPELQMPAIMAEENPDILQAKITSRVLYLSRMQAAEEQARGRRLSVPSVRFSR